MNELSLELLGTWCVISTTIVFASILWFMLRRSRSSRAAGLSPDGCPLPKVGSYVRALSAAVLTANTPCDYDQTVEGVVVRVGGGFSMVVQDGEGNLNHCLVAGAMPIPRPRPSSTTEKET